MKEKKAMVQSTIRVDEDLLYEAQYYLSHEKSSIAGFFKEKLREFVDDYRQAHPERVPGGMPYSLPQSLTSPPLEGNTAMC